MFSSVWWIGPLSFPTYGGVVAKSLQELQTLSTLEAGGRGLIRWLAAMALQSRKTPQWNQPLPQTIWKKLSILDIRHFLVSWYPVARKNEPTELG